MKAKKRVPTNESLLSAIFIHFQPRPSGGWGPSTAEFRGMMVGLSMTLPGQKRNKPQDAYQAERDWEHNLCFVAGLYTLIPPDNSVLKIEAEKLLLKMFGKGFAANRLERFNTAERQRTRKNGEAAWRLVKKLRRYYRLPPLSKNGAGTF